MFNDARPRRFPIRIIHSSITLEVRLIQNLIFKTDRPVLQIAERISKVCIDRPCIDDLLSQRVQLLFMFQIVHAKYFLPVHGEYKQLKKHAITAASLGIPTSNILIAENGSNIILSQDEMKLGEPVTAGAVMVDGLGVGDVGNVVLRDRKHLSEDGLVIIVATVDSKTGKVLAGPDLVSRGFVYVRENESLMDGAQSIVETALDRCVDEHVRDWNSVKTRVREALSSYIYRRTKRSPMILPILMEV